AVGQVGSAAAVAVAAVGGQRLAEGEAAGGLRGRADRVADVGAGVGVHAGGRRRVERVAALAVHAAIVAAAVVGVVVAVELIALHPTRAGNAGGEARLVVVAGPEAVGVLRVGPAVAVVVDAVAAL